MDKLAKLREQIVRQSPRASRGLLVAYLKLLAEKAKSTPMSKLESRGNYSTNIQFPQTIGEGLASEISSCLAWQEWVNEDDTPDLAEVASTATQLERSTDSHALWQKLLSDIDNLT